MALQGCWKPCVILLNLSLSLTTYKEMFCAWVLNR